MNWLPASDRVEYCLPIPFSGKEFYGEIFMKCSSLHTSDMAQNHKWHWTYHCETNTRKNSLSFFSANIWSKINPMLKQRLLLYTLESRIIGGAEIIGGWTL